MQLTTIAIFIIGFISTWASAVPMNLERRASVNCKAKYRGKLYSSNVNYVTDTSEVNQRGFPSGIGNDNYLKDEYDNQGQFQFDECTTSGWNQSPKEFGQLKYVSSGNYQAVTAQKEETGSGHTLRLQNAASSNNGLLDRQWWYAYWKNDKEGGAYVTLHLNGNPNDSNDDYELPYAGISDSKLTASTTDTGYTYTLYDITYP